MKKRIISGIALLFILGFSIMQGEILLRIFSFILAFVGLFELYSVLKLKYELIIVNYLMLILLIIFLDNKTYILLIVTVYLVFLAIYYVINQKINIMTLSISILVSVYISFAFYCVYMIGLLGRYFIIYLFILAWTTDAGAYVIGKKIGKTKLSPIISPNKTIEGAAGGFVLTTVICYFYSELITDKNLYLVIFSQFIAILSIFGDLFFSKIKRELKIKDYGKIIPGHGGVLDRFDSVILIAPIVYCMLVIMK